MITKELFIKFINQYKKYNSAFERLEEALMGRKYISNLYESDWNEAVGYMLELFLESHFTEEGCDLINWWLFEDVPHIIYTSYEADLFNKEIKIQYDVENIEDLWDYMIKHKKDYING